MTHREMHQWLTYLEMQMIENTKEDWYQAQIAYMIYMLQFVFGGSPKHKLEDFLIKFKKKEETVNLIKLTPQEHRDLLLKKAKASQQIWEAVLGKKAKQGSSSKKTVRNSEKSANGRKNTRRKGPG